MRTLQYYDKKGLLTPSGYSEGGRRMYSRQDIIRLQQILFFKSMGFTLEEIRDQILPADSTYELEQIFKQQQQVLMEQISQLQGSVHQLEDVLSELKLGTDVSIEKLLAILKATQRGNPYSFLIRHMSQRQMEYFSNQFESEEAAIEFNKNFRDITAELIDLYQQKEDPEGPAGQELANRWWRRMMI